MTITKKKLEAATATMGELTTPTIDWAKKCKISLGADPEFIMSYKGAKIGARTIFQTDNSQLASGGIGHDGNADTGELRPKHAYSPKGLVQNTQKLFAEACMKHPTFASAEWLSGANKFGHNIGGHIHFGIAEDVWNARNLTLAMDYFLMLNVMQMEPTDEAKVRKGGRYGQLGDIRRQTWGVEYRPLASWLHSPALMLAVLSLAKHIANQALINPKIFVEFDFNGMMGGSNYDTILDKYKRHDVAFFKKHREAMWRVIDSWPMEPDIKDGVEIFKTMLAKDYKFGRGDFKLNWGLEFLTAGAKVEGLVSVDTIL